ncbi:MAG: DUF899 domain-containing protein [Nitrospira sp.]|nr:MAG: DUF899 domain-containing protein [Nitrospira sp.]
MQHTIVSDDEWLKARTELLVKEKEFTKLRDAITAQIRALPWRTVEKAYAFDTATGKQTLAGLFGGKSQLAVYHFMLGPEWDQGCKSCSFWADGFQGIPIHLAHRDVSFIVVSHAPLVHIEQFRKRMGWNIPWVSSFGSDFNFDFGVSFTEKDERAGRAFYNYTTSPYLVDESPGASFFYRQEQEIFHTYSTYGRGLDLLNCAYNWLDLVPKGRDENPENTMDWVRHHDRYEDVPKTAPSCCGSEKT